MNVGKTIAELRKSRDMTQDALAERLFVSRDLVSKWENGTRRPDYPTVERIAEVFGVPAESIVERDEYLFGELADCLPDGVGIPEDRLTARLNEFLGGLRRQEAALFVERYYLLRTVAEIAGAHGMGENHVRSKLSKTRKKLKRYLLGVKI